MDTITTLLTLTLLYNGGNITYPDQPSWVNSFEGSGPNIAMIEFNKDEIDTNNPGCVCATVKADEELECIINTDPGEPNGIMLFIQKEWTVANMNSNKDGKGVFKLTCNGTKEQAVVFKKKKQGKRMIAKPKKRRRR